MATVADEDPEPEEDPVEFRPKKTDLQSGVSGGVERCVGGRSNLLWALLVVVVVVDSVKARCQDAAEVSFAEYNFAVLEVAFSR